MQFCWKAGVRFIRVCNKLTHLVSEEKRGLQSFVRFDALAFMLLAPVGLQ